MKKLGRNLLRRIAYRLGYQNLDHLTFLLESRLAKRQRMFIVQIGANDGRTYDPIHAFLMQHRDRVAALLLEPVGEYYDQLQRTYAGHPGVRTVRKAIHRTEKSMTIHRVDPRYLSSLPEFVKGIASFDPEYHRKSNTPPEYLTSEVVECMTLDELVESEKIEAIDLLCIDTEGYDSEIVRSIRFDRIRPTIVTFEHGLRDGVMSAEVFGEIVQLLNRHEYDVMVTDYDVVAHVRNQLVQ